MKGKGSFLTCCLRIYLTIRRRMKGRSFSDESGLLLSCSETNFEELGFLGR